jgi:hypothetical protein
MKLLALLVVLFASFGVAADVAAVEFDIVTNVNAPPKHMSFASVRDVYLLKRQFWANRDNIVIVLQPADAALHAAFCKKILGTNCDALTQAELEKRYAGTLRALIIKAPTGKDALVILKQYPSAIAYVRRGTKLDEQMRIVSE